MIGGGGERGIRTPGAIRLNGFQDRHLKPLGHLSDISARQAGITMMFVVYESVV